MLKPKTPDYRGEFDNACNSALFLDGNQERITRWNPPLTHAPKGNAMTGIMLESA
jgi:hypothetical protein